MVSTLSLDFSTPRRDVGWATAGENGRRGGGGTADFRLLFFLTNPAACARNWDLASANKSAIEPPLDRSGGGGGTIFLLDAVRDFALGLLLFLLKLSTRRAWPAPAARGDVRSIELLTCKRLHHLKLPN